MKTQQEILKELGLTEVPVTTLVDDLIFKLTNHDFTKDHYFEYEFRYRDCHFNLDKNLYMVPTMLFWFTIRNKFNQEAYYSTLDWTHLVYTPLKELLQEFKDKGYHVEMDYQPDWYYINMYLTVSIKHPNRKYVKETRV